jgi:hypothetical protein
VNSCGPACVPRREDGLPPSPISVILYAYTTLRTALHQRHSVEFDEDGQSLQQSLVFRPESARARNRLLD